MESGSRRLESPSPAERSRRLRPRAGLTALLLAACALRAGLTALLLAACALRAAGGPPQAAPPEAPPLEGARVIPAAVAAGRAEDFSAPNARPLVASADDLLRALDHLLLAAYPGRTLRWELVREGPFPDRAGRRFGLVPPSALAGGRVWFELEALDPPAATYLLPVDIAWQDSAWIAARPLPAGRCLAPADAARGLCWHARAPAALAGGAVEGLRLTRSIPAGAPLLAEDLVRLPDVPRGAVVRLVYQGPGLVVATRAKALDEGWTGSEIRVQPLDTRHVCAAIVRGAEVAEVIAP
ncbi:MAG: flagellar basal body P-ring formation protein FlgA [Candidatus Eisenbacteria bacterium]|uniref:Flagellar basal body P-ring formation protein FlgA n=1 Tax=Eiseniibacteriota bacterium TaxID=2212470 RepID=A0A937X9P4_UNCEI|nr:flagellar basal body P-ring formation protein FlgA [Candidatus Eisenbacteria bacterium]